LAIAHIEFLFGYRRPGPAMMAAVAVLTVTMGAMLTITSFLPKKSECLETINNILVDPEAVKAMELAGNKIISAGDFCSGLVADFFHNEANTTTVRGIHDSWFAFLFFSLIFMTAACVPAFAADRQYGASEWLDSLPITGWTILLGKILGLGTSALAGCLAVLPIFILITLILLHTFPFGFAASLALLDGLPVILWSVSLGTAVGVLFRKRISAAFAGVGIGFFNFLAWMRLFNPLYGKGNSYDTPAYSVFQFYGLESPFSNKITTWHVAAMYSAVLLVFLFLMAASRAWLSWKENT